MTDRAADDSAQNISAAVVGRHDAIGDHEGHGSCVVGADADGYVSIVGVRLLVGDASRKGAYEVTK